MKRKNIIFEKEIDRDKKRAKPRLHVVETSNGSYRQNRKHLVRLSVQEADGKEIEQTDQNETPSTSNSRETRSKTGHIVRPPDRLDLSWT